MNKCVYCGDKVRWKKRSSICEKCFDVQLKIKMVDEDRVDRVVEHPGQSWF